MKNLAGLMKQAQQMQSKMEEMQAKLEAHGDHRRIRRRPGEGDPDRQERPAPITIDPKIVDPADAEMLTDLIVAAHRDAKTRSKPSRRRRCGRSTGGLQLPAGMKLPF